jgi:hypothetical protein
MPFNEDISRLAEQIAQRKEHCKGNEEATKQALILPFFQVLGYDIWNPKELVPEFKAGWAVKEKIDYAIFIEGKHAWFVEAKAVGENLANYDPQLAKYFNATPEVKVALITDGLTYKFFTDSHQPNMMDPEPFFEFNIEALSPQDIDLLSNFRRDTFDVGSVLLKAENMVYFNGFMRKMKSMFNNPSEEFVKFIAADIYPSKFTSKALERLQPLVKQALQTTLVSMVSKGLIQGIADEAVEQGEVDAPKKQEKPDPTPIITTEEELAAYAKIVGIIEEVAGPGHKINYKDTQTYFSIQVDKPAKWFARLHFNNQKRNYIAFRIPEVLAKQLIRPEMVESYTSSTTEGCSVTYSSLSDIDEMKSLILESFKAQAAD